jgi:hypothetical protein
MMTIVSYLLFVSTLATSVAVLFHTLVPALPRIIALLQGREDIAAMPHLILRDRRSSSRARPAQPQTAPARRAAA